MTRDDIASFPENPFRIALRANRPLIGLWSMLNAPSVTEGLAYAGFDWIMIDGEHTPLTLTESLAHLRILAGLPVVPMVRLIWNDFLHMKAYLDAGAQTIMVPYVQDAEQAKAAVSAMRYPPRGQRGVAGMLRGNRYGRVPNFLPRAEEALFLIVQIETREAMDHLEEIAAVDGVDALFFGPSDISASLGLIGQPDHPDVLATIDEGLRRGRAAGRKVGVLAPSEATAERHVRAGFDFVSVATDMGLLFRNADATAAASRASAELSAATR